MQNITEESKTMKTEKRLMEREVEQESIYELSAKLGMPGLRTNKTAI